VVRCQFSSEVPNLSVGCASVRSSGLRRDGRGRFRRPRRAPDSSTGSSGSRGSSGTASSQSQSSLRRKRHCCFEPLCPVFFKVRFNRDHGPKRTGMQVPAYDDPQSAGAPAAAYQARGPAYPATRLRPARLRVRRTRASMDLSPPHLRHQAAPGPQAGAVPRSARTAQRRLRLESVVCQPECGAVAYQHGPGGYCSSRPYRFL
jgi:hypothetical protein